MSVKRKDFQKIASTIHYFLLKLTDTHECAELRDSLNLSLLQLQKYYRKCQQRLQHTGRCNLDNTGSGYVSPRLSLRITLSRSREESQSPMTPYIEEPQYFHANWTVIEEKADVLRRSLTDDIGSPKRSINTPPVHYAAMTGDFDMLTELHMEKVDVFEDQDCIGRTPMMYAAYHNKLAVVRWLLDRDVNLNSCDYNESTSLHWACSQGHVAIIELLLDAGADKDYQDSFGRSATHWACTCSIVDPLKLLIEFGANINLHDRNGLTAAMWACRLDHLEHLKLLSSVKNQNIDHIDGIERDRNGRTVIHWSIRRQQPFECLKYLLNDNTAQLKDDEGKTVLLLAAEQGCLESCKIIVEIFGTRFLSDVDDKDRTCLHLATVGGHGEVVNYMLEMGMNVNSKDKTGATCIEIARNQYLFYCQLIISSHIREKERKLDLEGSDNVEVIENIISRHNSISDTKNQPPVTPPRPPKSPKTNSITPKSPTLKRRLQHYSSSIEQNEDNANGFDVMQSDPIHNGFVVSPDSTRNNFELRDDDPARNLQKGPSSTHSPPPTRYVEPSSVDCLDNDTGLQYHGSFAQVNERHATLNNSINSQFDDRDFNLDSKVPKRTLKRAQQANRINSDRSEKERELRSSMSMEKNDYVQVSESESPTLRPTSIASPNESVPRINYGATLEPIRMESQLAPRRKKKRSNRPRKVVTQSQDRFSQIQNRESENPLPQAMSLDNLSLKHTNIPNGMSTKPHFPSSNPQPLYRTEAGLNPIGSMRSGALFSQDVQDRTLKRSPKINTPLEPPVHRFGHSSFPNL